MAGWFHSLLDSANGAMRRPAVNDRLESNVPGLYIAGDLAGAPVVKLAMEQGYAVARQILAFPDARGGDLAVWDVVIAGAGAAGLNCALELQRNGLRVLVLEKSKVASTIEDFPEGKWIYAEPEGRSPVGSLWMEAATKQDLLARWRQQAAELQVRTEEPVTALLGHKQGGFQVKTPKGSYQARRFVLATGQRGNPRWLQVPGEDRETVFHRLYSPLHYEQERILVVGGGNSAVEAALTLSARNQVTLSYRGDTLSRVFSGNRRQLDKAVAAGRIQVLLNHQVLSFSEGQAQTTSEPIAYDHAFVLIGASTPADFLHSLGIRLENEWTGNPVLSAALLGLCYAGMSWYRGTELPGLLLTLAAMTGLAVDGWRGSRWSWLAFSWFLCYTIYGNKRGPGHELAPYTGWGSQLLSFGGRSWGFWYSVIYSLLMSYCGLQTVMRWGVRRKDRFQIWRYVSLIGFQWLFFFLIPEFLFQWAVKYQWVGESLARDPNFANNGWRSYGLIYAWPLFVHTFFGTPHKVWIVWGVLLTFVIMPVFVLFHGKRYCSWICGCGGLADTLGDRWRHLAPKGRLSVRLEVMGQVILACIVIITALVVFGDAAGAVRKQALKALDWYGLIVDFWLVGLIPVALYPFFGGKVWCRYWCPLAHYMHLLSAMFTRWKVSRFAIYSNDKCIACGECTRYCQVGIDVMQFAMKQETITNLNTSCIGCGICVTVCPLDTLSFSAQPARPTLVQIQPAS
jgi:thioredoxin reductase/Pyruvate/2-oxoacid:ferredoxin oxidoreductase delta subunit